MTRFYLSFLLLLLAVIGYGQTARVQVIHNSPSPTVDIYANGDLLLNDFAFRTATSFLDLPAGVAIDIAVAPDTSTSAGSALVIFEDIVFDENETYVVTAGGVVGNMDTPFTLMVNNMAQETTPDGGEVALSVLHGSPDAPAVDVDARNVGTLITGLAYGTYTDSYLTVPAATYYLDVRPAGNPAVVATFEADVSGIGGQAATVFASGLLMGDPAFGLFAALADGTVVPLPAVVIPDLVINEIDYDQAGADEAEFIEIKNNGDSPANLENINLQLVNGSIEETYATVALPADAVDPGAYYVICFGGNAAAYCDFTVSDAIQNGGPDAVTLNYNTLTLDALSYEGSVPGFVEGSGDGLEDDSSVDLAGLSRFPDGTDTDMNNMDFIFACATPGEANVEENSGCVPMARVQVIHNSPSPTVDIYANGALLLNDFEFRTATPFIDLPAEVAIDIAVAPDTSTSVASALVTFEDIVFADDETYVVTAGGIVGNIDTPFELQVNAMAKETADDPATVEVAALHGSPNAPNVDIDARTIGTVIEDLAYGSYTAGYLVLEGATYYLDVRAAGDPNIVATFRADLGGLEGEAITVFASGLLGADPAFGLFAALADGTVVPLPAEEVARVQVIHNSPSPTVDIYANGDILLNDFEFRTATPFIFLPAGVELDIAVAPDTSTSAGSALVVFEDIVFENGETYVVTAGGIVADLDTPFELQVNTMARETAADASTVDVSVLHGSPNAPPVDVDARTIGTIIEGLTYGTYTDDYLTLDTVTYYLDVRATGSPDIVATFEADLSGLAGEAVTVFASGLLGDDPAFGLYAALADGTVVPLPAVEVARVQVIHNSPSPTVDIYANGDILLDDFAFRTATPYVFLPAGVEIDLAVAPDTSTSAGSALVVFEDIVFVNGETYVVIANGVVGDPDNPFGLEVFDMGRETGSDPEGVDVLAFHGSPGAPAVNVGDFLATPVFPDLAYGEFQGYGTIPADLYFFEVRTADGNDLVGYFRADLSGLAGGAAVVFASGILDSDPDFNLLAALPDGTVVPFQPSALLQIIHNSPAPAAEVVDVWVSNLNALLIDDFAFRTSTGVAFLPARFGYEFGIAPPDSDEPGDILFTLPEVTLDESQQYTIFANGIPGDPQTPFELNVNTGMQFRSVDDAQIDLAVFHGSPGAPAVDVTARGIAQLVDGLAYGELEPYIGVAPQEYYLEITPDDSDDLVGTFFGNLTGGEGLAGVVFASGLLSDDPAFGLFLALPSGMVIPLTPVARVQVIHNSPSPTVDVYANEDLLVDDFEFRAATPFVDLPTRTEIDLGVALGDSQSAEDAIANFPVTLEDGKTYIVTATGIVGDATTPFDLAIFDMGRERAASGEGVDLLLYHGSTDAPEVDVVVEGGPVLFDNTAYGNYNGYENVSAGAYVLNITPFDDNDNTVKAYEADLSSLDGGAATVFATGFFSGDDPAFGVWVALPDGTTFPLTEVNAAGDLADLVSEFTLFPNPASRQTRLQYALTESMDVTFQLFDSYGQLIRTQYRGQQPAGRFSEDMDVTDLSAGTYYFRLLSEEGSLTQRLVIVK